MYVQIPFGVPVHAEGPGTIPAGINIFSTVLVCTGFGKSIFPRDFTARERKTTGNQTFPRQLFGWERDVKISSGTVWMGSRERYLHGIAREREKKTFAVKSCGKFPVGIFPRKALAISSAKKKSLGHINRELTPTLDIPLVHVAYSSCYVVAEL